MLSCDKDKLLEIGKKNEQTEINCLKRIIRIPTCCHKKHDMKPIISLLTREFEKRGYKVRAFSTSGAPVVVADLDQGLEKTLLFYNFMMFSLKNH